MNIISFRFSKYKERRVNFNWRFRVSTLARTHSGAFKPHLQVLNVESGLSWIAQSVKLSFFRFSLSEIKNAPHLSNIPPGVRRAGLKNNLYYIISGKFVAFFCNCYCF